MFWEERQKRFTGEEEECEFVQHTPASAQGGHNLHHKKGILKGGMILLRRSTFPTLPGATYSEGLQTTCPLGDG